MSGRCYLTVLLKDGEPMQCGFDKYEEFDEYAKYLKIMYPEYEFWVEEKFISTLDIKYGLGGVERL